MVGMVILCQRLKLPLATFYDFHICLMNLLKINRGNLKKDQVPAQCLEAAYTCSVNRSEVPPIDLCTPNLCFSLLTLSSPVWDKVTCAVWSVCCF